MCMLEELPSPGRWLDVPVFGTDGLGAEGLICAMQLIFLRSSEWSKYDPVWLLETDIAAAFDNLSHDLVCRALLSFGCDPIFVSAILFEMFRTKATIPLQGHCQVEGISLSKCIRQGGVEACKLWTICIVYLLEPVVERWRSASVGFNVNGKMFNIVVWVDNIWLFATSWQEMVDMGQEVSRALQPMLPWKPSSLKYVTTSEESRYKKSFTLPNFYEQ